MGRIFLCLSVVLSVAKLQANGIGEPERRVYHHRQGHHMQDELENEQFRFDHFEDDNNLEHDPACTNALHCKEEVLANFKPRFNKRAYTVTLGKKTDGDPVVPYNATTYRGHPDCLCRMITYDIIDENDKEIQEHGEPLFSIDKLTGELMLSGPLRPFSMAAIDVMVMNKVNKERDITTVTVHRDISDDGILDQFEPFDQNGFGDSIGLPDIHPHHRQKRAISSGDVVFGLTKITDISEARVGHRVQFELSIEFPAEATDMSVELFAPDNETTIMIICDVEYDITNAGNLNIASPTPVNFAETIGSKNNDITKEPDHYTINLGIVQRNTPGTTTGNTLLIKFWAVTVENLAAKNDTDYCVSVGSEFDTGNFIWVSMACMNVIMDGNMTVADDIQFSADLPADVTVGGTYFFPVSLFLPAPTRDYKFKVSAPPNTIGVMSVCGAWFDAWGENFNCGNDANAILEQQTHDPQGPGNMIAEVDLKTLLNKGSRDDPLPATHVEDSTVNLTFAMQMLETDLSQINMLMTIEMDELILYVGSHSFNVLPELLVNMPVPTVTKSTSLATSYDAIIGEPFEMRYTFDIPDSDNAGRMVLNITGAYSGGAPVFSVCSFRLKSKGRNLPCLLSADVQVEFSSEGNNDLPNKASLDLGWVKKLNIFSGDVTDNQFEVVATFTAQRDHPSAIAGSNFAVNLDVIVGGSVTSYPTTINLASVSAAADVTNLTQPIFTTVFQSGSDTYESTGDGMLLLTMAMQRNVWYDVMALEFLSPTPIGHVTPIHVCKVEVIDSGKNLPCLNPHWVNDRVEYLSANTDNPDLHDRAKLDFASPTCDNALYSPIEEDKKQFAWYFKVLPDPSTTSVTPEYVLSAGVQFSNDTLWTGINKIKANLNMNIPGTAFTYMRGTAIIKENIPVNYMGKYTVLYKIQPGAKVHLRVVATSSNSNLDICHIRVLRVGSNMPCVSNELSQWEAGYWSDGHRNEVTMNLGVVNNYGQSASLVGNNYFDDDSIEFVITTRPTVSGVSTNFDVNFFTDSQMTLLTTESFTTDSTAPPAIDPTVTSQVTANLEYGDLGDWSAGSNVSAGEAVPVQIKAIIPENTKYELDFSFTIPSSLYGKVEICDAYVYKVGLNLPCVDPTTPPVFTVQEGLHVAASFSFLYACNDPVNPGHVESNTLVLVAWVRVLNNGLLLPGDTVDVSGSLQTSGTVTTMTTSSIALNVVDDFTSKVMQPQQYLPDLISNWTSPTVMTIGERRTIPVRLVITPFSSFNLKLDIDLPYDDNSACMTFTDIRVIGSGTNLLCFPNSQDAVTRGEEFSENVTYTSPTKQWSYVLNDLNIVVNTGKTVSQGIGVDEDNYIDLEVDIQMADCEAAVDGASFNFSLGARLPDYVSIASHDVTVLRTGSEVPDVDCTVTAVGDGMGNIVLTGSVFHASSSQGELWNASVMFYLPTTLEAPDNIIVTSSNDTDYLLEPFPGDSGTLHITFDHFLFSDRLDFEALLVRNDSVTLPATIILDESVGYSEIIGDVYARTEAVTPPYDTYPFWVSQTNNFPIDVNATEPGCNSLLGMSDGSILDCQIVSSHTDLQAGFNGRLNGQTAVYWSPYVRRGALSVKRHLQVFLCNPALMRSLEIWQGGSDQATQLVVAFSNDFRSWFRHQTLDNIPATTGIVYFQVPVSAKAIRISVTNDTQDGAADDLRLQFELYGCYEGSGVCPSICADTTAAVNDLPLHSDFSPRTMAEGINQQLYVCDRSAETDEYMGICKTTVDGTTWNDVDSNVATMIGYDQVNEQMFGYSQDRNTVMFSQSGSDQWFSVSRHILEDAKTGSWTPAIALPEDRNQFFDTEFATNQYKTASGKHGATFSGVQIVGVSQILDWSR